MTEFSQPPPNIIDTNTGINVMSLPVLPSSPIVVNSYLQRPPPFRPFMNMMRPLPGALSGMTLEDFDGKRLRKSVMRKTVDYNASIIKELETRVWQRDSRDRRSLQPDVMYYPDLMPPPSYLENPINCVTTRFVKTATNKMRCPIFCMAWTPEGRRLVTGASSGEFTLWNGLTFNFETILQAHDSPVRTMVWSHNDTWMITGDHTGYVKYWQSNMNNVKMFQAHKEALRGISFSPTDTKFVTCSDDGTLRIWDFFHYQEERTLRGHGADVKCVHWHPQKSLIVSGSKDNQQPIKLWDPKTGQSLATLHAHKSTVMDLKWNENGNWLITASRDHLLKLFDLRNLTQEVQTFRGHKKEASSVAWHPIHEGLFCSGGSDGSIMFWHVGADKEVGAIEQAHDSIVWTLSWHPLGHILCTGSNDHTSKFWTRNRPGDLMRDKYNLNTLPLGISSSLDDIELTASNANLSSASVMNNSDEHMAVILPGMGPDDKVEFTSAITLTTMSSTATIPGLDLDANVLHHDEKSRNKKVPFSKPIPKNFQAQWNDTSASGSNINLDGSNDEYLSAHNGNECNSNESTQKTSELIPVQIVAPNAIVVYGKLIHVESGSQLESVMADGEEALAKFINSGAIQELPDLGGTFVHKEDDSGRYNKRKLPTTQTHSNSCNYIKNENTTQLNRHRDQDMRSLFCNNNSSYPENSLDRDFRTLNRQGQQILFEPPHSTFNSQFDHRSAEVSLAQRTNISYDHDDFREYYDEDGELNWSRNGNDEYPPSLMGSGSSLSLNTGDSMYPPSLLVLPQQQRNQLNFEPPPQDEFNEDPTSAQPLWTQRSPPSSDFRTKTASRRSSGTSNHRSGGTTRNWSRNNSSNSSGSRGQNRGSANTRSTSRSRRF